MSDEATTTPAAKAPAKSKKLALILIRGRIGFKQEVKDTLDMFRLGKKHACVIIDEKENTKGMLQKVKDAITWGTVDEATIKLLKEKAGEQKVYHLHPPRGGFERKGIKKPFNVGGALGDRKDKMGELIKRML